MTDPRARTRALLDLRQMLRDEARRLKLVAKVARDRRRLACETFRVNTIRRADFWSVLGPPPLCAPADVRAARAFLHRIDRVIELGGWSRAHRGSLSRLRATWAARAAGRDARFTVIGNRPGNLSAADRARLSTK